MKNIDIRYPAGIGVSDIDVYKTNKKKAYITTPTYFLKIRTTAGYDGEFGFDWIDVDATSGMVQKIQGVGFNEIEYFYKKPSNPGNPMDLGDIVPVSADTTAVRESISSRYSVSELEKTKIDIPWVFMKPGQSIELNLEVNVTAAAGLTSEAIHITGDQFYEFTIREGTKTGNKTEKSLGLEKVIILNVKCLKEAPDKEYSILQESASGTPFKVGGFKMMENKVQKIKFRVIALVSSGTDAADKAKKILQKFTDEKISNYLNAQSMNQAGYEVEIENQTFLDNLATTSTDINDYFYAFDKTDWTNKKYFAASFSKLSPDVIPGTNECKPGSWDSTKSECALVTVIKDVIVHDQKDLGLPEKSNELDNLVYKEYQEKLKTLSKDYSGGIIILSEYESSNNYAGAYSRSIPLNHYKLFVYSTNIGSKATYSHEIGHMLGLPHLFYDTEEKGTYDKYKLLLLGNGKPEINPDNTTNNDFGLYNFAREIEKAKYEFRGWRGLTAIREDMIRKMDTHNEKRKVQISNFEKEILKFAPYPDSYVINFSDGTKKTKKKHTEDLKDSIKNSKNSLQENTDAVKELKSRKGNNYESLDMLANFTRTDLVVLLKQNITYALDVLEQITSNYIMFRKEKTDNMMDYSNVRKRFLHNQIRIMRKDLQNYIRDSGSPPAVSKLKK
ncbi:hypothetical protein [Chryseobacterium sp. OV279]|uniref:hypothetical protein n=1 Tax=Chryseobacterium sp. OV279 TaxID=1500285 RepID=UPI00091D9E86|nr:hypothetical protein [Chryseobacterium sp. OV279]SHG34723.1 hypothetical protein SAMN02787100_3862 [Chryseobacterium sp. OV279]